MPGGGGMPGGSIPMPGGGPGGGGMPGGNAPGGGGYPGGGMPGGGMPPPYCIMWCGGGGGMLPPYGIMCGMGGGIPMGSMPAGPAAKSVCGRPRSASLTALAASSRSAGVPWRSPRESFL